jgi:predicted transcriptional regulator
VPVVEGDRVIGIVSEGDLLHRTETGTERRIQSRRSRWFDNRPREESARDYVRSHGRTVSDLMTRKVISVADTAHLAEVAAVMEANRIKRVPVNTSAMVVFDGGPRYSHWTVVKTVTKASLILFDADGMKRVPLDPGARGRVRLPPREVYLLSCER